MPPVRTFEGVRTVLFPGAIMAKPVKFKGDTSFNFGAIAGTRAGKTSARAKSGRKRKSSGKGGGS